MAFPWRRKPHGATSDITSWSHVVWTRDGRAVRMYVNGEEVVPPRMAVNHNHPLARGLVGWCSGQFDGRGGFQWEWIELLRARK